MDAAVEDIYGEVINGFPNLRMLVTISQQDKALQWAYPLAGKINIFHIVQRKALGANGPNDAVRALFHGDIGQLSIDVDFDANESDVLAQVKHKLVIADLSPIHQKRCDKSAGEPLYNADSWGGSHSDIFFEQLYSVIAKFLY